MNRSEIADIKRKIDAGEQVTLPRRDAADFILGVGDDFDCDYESIDGRVTFAKNFDQLELEFCDEQSRS